MELQAHIWVLAFLQTFQPLPDPHTLGSRIPLYGAEVEAPAESLGFLPVRDGALAVSPEPRT